MSLYLVNLDSYNEDQSALMNLWGAKAVAKSKAPTTALAAQPDAANEQYEKYLAFKKKNAGKKSAIVKTVSDPPVATQALAPVATKTLAPAPIPVKAQAPVPAAKPDAFAGFDDAFKNLDSKFVDFDAKMKLAEQKQQKAAAQKKIAEEQNRLKMEKQRKEKVREQYIGTQKETSAQKKMTLDQLKAQYLREHAEISADQKAYDVSHKAATVPLDSDEMQTKAHSKSLPGTKAEDDGTGVIIGITIGVLLLIILSCFAGYYFYMKKLKEQQNLRESSKQQYEAALHAKNPYKEKKDQSPNQIYIPTNSNENSVPGQFEF